MQERMFMNKSSTPVRNSSMNQARLEKEEKERKTNSKDRGQEADGKIGSPTKQKVKNTLEEPKQGLPRHN